MNHKHVSAAIIHDQQGRIFATQRGSGDWKDWWEFPGGKIEPGETPEEALKREIWEELETRIVIEQLVTTVEWDYPKFHLTMHCFWCHVESGELTLKEHEAARWLSRDELDSVQWLPADLGVIEVIRNKMEQLERIGQMECLLEEALDRYEAAQSAIRSLETYYDSEEWMKDFSDDEQGRLPKELKRGVLSEDAIWNLLEENRDLKERMKGI